MSHPVKREALVLCVLLACGVLLLPFAIYVVGINMIGEYEPGADAVNLAIDLWSALARGHWAAWLLVASPYLIVQGMRLAGLFWRHRKPVTRITESDGGRRNWRV